MIVESGKSGRLGSLEEKIWKCDKCDFDAETDARFCGGKGNDFRVIFITKAPSTSGGTGKFRGCENYGATKADDLFHRVKAKFGLGNCYTTDFVKCGRRSKRNPPLRNVEQCAEYTREEVRIVNPKVIVAVGTTFKYVNPPSLLKFEELLRKYLKTQLPIIATWHYSYVRAVLTGYRRHPSLTKEEVLKEYDEQHRKILNYL